MVMQAQPKRRRHGVAGVNCRCQWEDSSEADKDIGKEGKDIQQHDNELLHLSKTPAARWGQGALHDHILVVQGLPHAIVCDKNTCGRSGRSQEDLLGGASGPHMIRFSCVVR